ncbi:Uncharacterised protein [Serratia quinivorans]|uniref:DUF4056 domain-containing protein n=1 Tax=Serratia quinivorans TaxID=137545 RepID=UPI000D97B193|nr:DUF4056 domain-containing protein [Serratia quinivorans]SPZ64000.1 Uncharacterised protein [Serratia quinivorans]VEI63181.1 Uncharacterised protein [Serratia quinivorans]
MRSVALLFFLLLPLSLPAKPLETLITSHPVGESQIVWPVAAPLPPPGGLRPCCAFGYNLKAQAWGIPVPLYQLGNLVDADRLGTHHYNDSAFNAISNLLGIGSEQLGLIYTHRGGFIDIAHVRDTADNTLFLFSQLLPRLGQQWHIDLSPELATRRIQLNAFSPPQDAAQRYTLAAYLAGEIAFQMAAWHEIAQWYGYRSVPGFSEEVSAFSPEDLYSNLLGARLAIDAILQGQAVSLTAYNSTMERLLPQALHQLGAVSIAATQRQFDGIDGDWWDSHRRVPEKFLVLKRDYATGSNRLPALPPFEKTAPQRLTLPLQLQGFSLASLGELQLWPTDDMRHLPAPAHYYRPQDFNGLALHARAADAQQILQNARQTGGDKRQTPLRNK